MDRKRVKLSMNVDAYNYIKEYMEEKNIAYPGDAISQICKEHQEKISTEWSLKYISEVVTMNVKEVFKNELNKIRVGTNNADRNTQILIELLNGLFIHESIEDIISTSISESQGLKTAKSTVQTRIEEQRQRKLDWEKSKGGIENAIVK